ncbi:hypothetical protein KJ596_04675 [Patescibacteria group bacterium]|nr:hypothetical protein [Patescibacteria group bacterium]MBU1868612.1 hypothetical protein [Patescibacteria group bacterium]
MQNFCPLFLPVKQNKHRPHLLRHYSLFPLFAAFILLQVNLAVFYSSNPQILSFATSIYQQDFFTFINQERATAKLPSLTQSQSLNRAAELKAQHMFNQNYWAHVAPDGTTPWDFFESVDYNYSHAGENLAKDFNTTSGVVAGWMGSSSHRSNVLNSNFKEMGIAVVNGILQGEETTLVVQLFGTPIILAEESTSTSIASSQTNTPATELPAEESTAPAQVYTYAHQEQAAEEEVELYPQSLATSTSPEKSYKPRGIAAQIRSGLLNFRNKASLATDPRNWGMGQQTTILFFMFLVAILLGDSLTLWRKGIERTNSHSLMHAGIVGILIILTMASSIGSIL